MFGRTEHQGCPEGDDVEPGMPDTEGPPHAFQAQRKLSNAALRRELWRDNQQQSVEDHVEISKSFLFAPSQQYQPPTRQPLLQTHDSAPAAATSQPGGEVFKFDSFDRDRYLPREARSCEEPVSVACGHYYYPIHGAHSPYAGHIQGPHALVGRHPQDETGEEVFTPASGRSPHSSLSSPQVSVDSPRICFSPLRIKDSIEEEDETGQVIHRLPRLSVRCCESEENTNLPHHPMLGRSGHLDPHHQLRFERKLLSALAPSSLSRPISPNPSVTPTTPISPSPYLHTLSHLPTYLTDVYKRRCLSETDLSHDWEDQMIASHLAMREHIHHTPPMLAHTHQNLLMPYKGGSLESEASSTQESPLDLSVRSSISSTTSTHSFRGALLMSTASMENIQKKRPGRGRGRSRSTNFGRGAGSLSGDRYTDRYSLDRLEVSSAVSEPAGTPPLLHGEVAYVCPVCGQIFAIADRLAKHMASRHKSRSTDSGSRLPHMCDLCNRTFARSDMLTRHMRLHTGIKPYTCRICSQVFSRSDHLSTHQRTHTGEKPYQCPTCPYAACRRDMITRHMRTHARYELQDSTSLEDPTPVTIETIQTTSGSGFGHSPAPGPGSEHVQASYHHNPVEVPITQMLFHHKSVEAPITQMLHHQNPVEAPILQMSDHASKPMDLGAESCRT